MSSEAVVEQGGAAREPAGGCGVPAVPGSAPARQRIAEARARTRPAVGIRRAREHEYRAIGELTYAAYAHDYPVSAEYALTLRHPESRLDLFEVWVAEDPATGALLGTTSILRPGAEYERRVEGELYFRLLAVSPDARRRGIGAALTNLADDLARERALTAVSLNSAQHMTVAHSLYHALGFTRVPERDVHILDGDDHRVVYTFVRPVR